MIIGMIAILVRKKMIIILGRRNAVAAGIISRKKGICQLSP
ncbi:hypothetical protein [Metabacillus arenae]|nr:hypothetical protein [Metabacillus arenae]